MDGDVSEKEPLGHTDIELENVSSFDQPEDSELMRQLYFKDGERRIDFILVYSRENRDYEIEEKQEYLLADLKQEGLMIEKDEEDDRKEVFVKIHAPFDTLARYAEIMKIRKPMKQTLFECTPQSLFPMKKSSWKTFARCTDVLKMFHHKEGTIPTIERQFTWPYSVDKQFLFAIPENKADFFDSAERGMIVDYILRRARFTEQSGMFGLAKLLQDGIFLAAYPLHEYVPCLRELKEAKIREENEKMMGWFTISPRPISEGSVEPASEWNTRRLLYETWAHPRNCFKRQPLKHIRQYFGEKIALYFAWIGFYTFWLIPASLIGLAVIIYGILLISHDPVIREVCESNVTMCPLCRAQCPFWNLSDSCNMAKLGRVVDNGATVFFAIFMAFWSTLFLEMWKRYQAKLAYEWSVFDFEREEAPPRPEFMSLLDTNRFKRKQNILSGQEEPFIPFWRHRFPVTFFSFFSVILLVSLAIAFVVGVIVYRVSVYTTLKTRDEAILHKSASIVSSCTAATMNLIVIVILNLVYNRLAVWLTDKEHHRTQPDYEDSLTLKLYLLKFVNFYSSIFYIAFFKGRRFTSVNRFSEQCQAGGCLIDLCVQMIIIMCGKQIINGFTENVVPVVLRRIKRILRKRCCTKDDTSNGSVEKHTSRWETDYQLDDQGPRPLFFEYLEMNVLNQGMMAYFPSSVSIVVQFGFMTIFVTAFPLAPLFALLNNIFEIRGDAFKFVMNIRRPVARRARTIGIWQTILCSISRLSILTNAAIIALTAEFIPRFLYRKEFNSSGRSLEGFINFTLSYHNASEFNAPVKFSGQFCRFRGYRNPPWSAQPGEYSAIYWQICAAQFVFVVIFENVVIYITALIAWLIPDISSKLKAVMIREVTLTNEIILKAELRRQDNRPAVNLSDVMHQVRRRPMNIKNNGGREAVA